MSLALARKYRPATFDDLIGQEAVSQTLSLALDGDRLSHAYLFSGLRGSGKTSTARIFAKALLCEKGTSSHPCGTCPHCIMASENRHMDIIEMDAASNRGIDDIKDLIEHTKYKPSSARYKIFIIDEVHMLTNQAFNALLKTLEEPPGFVKFILATTDPLKLPATILSRTQHFRFKKIPQNLVLKHLEHILNLENIEYEKEALEIIARTGAGSLRDSLTLMDQAIVYSKNFVDVGTVTGMLGIIEPSLLEELLDDIFHKDNTKILAFIKIAADYEAEMILDELTLYLKELLLNKNTKFTPMIIERFFRVIAESKGLLALGSDGEFVLTLALFKMMEALEIKEIDMMIKSLEKELQGVKANVLAAPAITPSATEETPVTPRDVEASLPPEQEAVKKEEIQKETLGGNLSVDTTKEIQQSAPEEEPTAKTQTALIEEDRVDNSSTTLRPKEEVTQTDPYQKTFDRLIQKIYDRDYDLGACFERNIGFESFVDGKLTWSSTAEGADKRLLITHWGVINMFVKELFGIETKIVNVTKEKAQNNPVEAKKVDTPLAINEESCNASASMIEDVEMKSSCIAPEAGENEASKEKESSTILEEPMVKKAISLFDPKRVRIKRNS